MDGLEKEKKKKKEKKRKRKKRKEESKRKRCSNYYEGSFMNTSTSMTLVVTIYSLLVHILFHLEINILGTQVSASSQHLGNIVLLEG